MTYVAAGDGVVAPEVTRRVLSALHVSRVLAKLGCTSRVQAAIIAKESGPA